jgi:hypothetical protein
MPYIGRRCNGIAGTTLKKYFRRKKLQILFISCQKLTVTLIFKKNLQFFLRRILAVMNLNWLEPKIQTC